MIISRRQRESLIDEMSRMLANRQHVAFANHVQIAERISNGDLALYINSPNKEFCFKHTDNIIRIKPKDLTIENINQIVFKDKSVISGITDT